MTISRRERGTVPISREAELALRAAVAALPPDHHPHDEPDGQRSHGTTEPVERPRITHPA